MTVLLLGGPLHGERVAWPDEGDALTLPVAEIVVAFGRAYDPPLRLEQARYRIPPLGENLFRLAPVALFAA